MSGVAQAAMLVGRILLAILFIAGAIQKFMAPEVDVAMLADWHLPGILVWPAFAANIVGAICLVFGIYLAPTALALAGYCIATSLFHYIPDDPWQMSIFIKNWAIAGGLLVLFAHEVLHAKG